jgi:hypothetical protein
MFFNVDGGFLEPANFRSKGLAVPSGQIGTSQVELSGVPANHRHQSTEAGFGEGR